MAFLWSAVGRLLSVLLLALTTASVVHASTETYRDMLGERYWFVPDREAKSKRYVDTEICANESLFGGARLKVSIPTQMTMVALVKNDYGAEYFKVRLETGQECYVNAYKVIKSGNYTTEAPGG